MGRGSRQTPAGVRRLFRRAKKDTLAIEGDSAQTAVILRDRLLSEPLQQAPAATISERVAPTISERVAAVRPLTESFAVHKVSTYAAHACLVVCETATQRQRERVVRERSFAAHETHLAAEIATQWDDEAQRRNAQAYDRALVDEQLRELERLAASEGVTCQRVKLAEPADAQDRRLKQRERQAQIQSRRRAAAERYQQRIAPWRELLGHYSADEVQEMAAAHSGDQALSAPTAEEVRSFVDAAGLTSARRGERSYASTPDPAVESALVARCWLATQSAAEEMGLLRCKSKRKPKRSRPRAELEFSHQGEHWRFAANAEGVSDAALRLQEIIDSMSTAKAETQAAAEAINNALAERQREQLALQSPPV